MRIPQPRIMVACADLLLREGLIALLEATGDVDVIGSEGDARVAFESAVVRGAAAVIVDAELLPSSDDEWPEFDSRVGNPQVIVIASKGGSAPRGAVTVRREMGALPLLRAVRRVIDSAPRTTIDVQKVHEARQTYGASSVALTDRELQVATLVAKGYGNRQISEALGLREQSVKNLVSVILSKMGCDNRTQVALRLRGLAS